MQYKSDGPLSTRFSQSYPGARPRCATCRHFAKEYVGETDIETSRWGDVEEQWLGFCTLNPEWVQKWESSFCSQHQKGNPCRLDNMEGE